MSKLILSIEGATLKEVPLVKERTTIGRKPLNDIQIDNLAISGEHAVLLMIGNDAFLEDIGSTNGTFVNGQPIKRQLLQNGDIIELGKYSLKYVGEAVQHAAEADFEKTMILRSGAMMPTGGTGRAVGTFAHEAPSIGMMVQPAATVAPARAPAVLPLGAIQILSGGNAGKELELTKTLTTLGKPKVQVAVIARRPHGYFISHVEGASFPVIDGKMIGTQACQLNDHAIIEVAGTKMEFFLKT